MSLRLYHASDVGESIWSEQLQFNLLESFTRFITEKTHVVSQFQMPIFVRFTVFQLLSRSVFIVQLMPLFLCVSQNILHDMEISSNRAASVNSENPLVVLEISFQ